MDEKITIIEGPPPTFEAVNESWALGLNESPILADIAVTRLRTFNGPALVERCYRAWRNQQPIHLEFKTEDSQEVAAPIVAARYIETGEGDMLLLWVRLPKDETEFDLEYDDDDLDDLDDLDDDDLDELDDDEDNGPGMPLGPGDWTL